MSDADATVTGRLQMTMTASLLKSITVLTKNLPEDTATWLNKQLMQQMMPKTVTPSLPQSAPATED